MKDSAFSDEDIENVLAGEIVVTDVKHRSDRELAVGLACLVAESADPMAAFDRERPTLPSSSIAEFERIDPVDPQRAFEKVQLHAAGRGELGRYLDFESGIGLNLSPAEIATFRAVRSSHSGRVPDPVVDSAIQGALRERYETYRREGTLGIAPYLREGGNQVYAGKELDKIVDQSHVLGRHFPKFMNMWKAFPRETLSGAEETYFWIRSLVRDRPMMVLAHQVAWRDGKTRMIGERIFYASHFFNVGHTIVLSTPTKEGRLFALVERIWIDGYSGFSGTKHALGERMLKRKMVDQVGVPEICLLD